MQVSLKFILLRFLATVRPFAAFHGLELVRRLPPCANHLFGDVEMTARWPVPVFLGVIHSSQLELRCVAFPFRWHAAGERVNVSDTSEPNEQSCKWRLANFPVGRPCL